VGFGLVIVSTFVAILYLGYKTLMCRGRLAGATSCLARRFLVCYTVNLLMLVTCTTCFDIIR
jgi:hypothetical protein